MQDELPRAIGAAVRTRVHLRVGVCRPGADERQGQRGGHDHPQHLVEHRKPPSSPHGPASVAGSWVAGRGSNGTRVPGPQKVTWPVQYEGPLLAKTTTWSREARFLITRVKVKFPLLLA